MSSLQVSFDCLNITHIFKTNEFSISDPDASDTKIPLLPIVELKRFLKRLLDVITETDEALQDAIDEELSKPIVEENLSLLIKEPQMTTIVLQTCRTSDDRQYQIPVSIGRRGGANFLETFSDSIYNHPVRINIVFGNDLSALETSQPAILVLKTVSQLTKGASLFHQILTTTISGTQIDCIQNLLTNILNPLFKSHVKAVHPPQSAKIGSDSLTVDPSRSSAKISEREVSQEDAIITSIERKFTELQLSIANFKFKSEIPVLNFSFLPEITSLADQFISPASIDNNIELKNTIEKLSTDPNFVNSLQTLVNGWINEIRKLTSLDHDILSGEASKEVEFWSNFRQSLVKLEQKLKIQEFKFSIEVLRCAKRFNVIINFERASGISKYINVAMDYENILKDLPYQDLLSSMDVRKLRTSIVNILSHLRRIRNSSYPVERLLKLIECISEDLKNQLLRILIPRKLLIIPYSEFERCHNHVSELFLAWNDEYEKLHTIIRDIIKIRREDSNSKHVMRANIRHKKLQARLDAISSFRRTHEQLRNVISKVMCESSGGGKTSGSVSEINPEDLNLHYERSSLPSCVRNVDEAFLFFAKSVDCLDESKNGQDAWSAQLRLYDEKIDVIEARIIARLRDQLGTARNASEMFRIFSRYNLLFVRPQIRIAIKEYQNQLIACVKDDIEALLNRYKKSYESTSFYRACKFHDIPHFSGSLMWMKQIDNQLLTYIQRIEAILGKGYEQSVEGQKLKKDIDGFCAQLSVQQLFDKWSANIQNNLSQNADKDAMNGKIFKLDSRKTIISCDSSLGEARKTITSYQLKVNFSPEAISLAKEVRYLRYMGFRLNLGIVSFASQTSHIFPWATCLRDTLKTYDWCINQITTQSPIYYLTASLQREIQEHIIRCSSLNWLSYKTELAVQKLNELVVSFQESIDELVMKLKKIDECLNKFEFCDYTESAFNAILSSLQSHIDEIVLRSYSNIDVWLGGLDKLVENKLKERLKLAISTWSAFLTICDKIDIASSKNDENSIMSFKEYLLKEILKVLLANSVISEDLNPKEKQTMNSMISKLMHGPTVNLVLGIENQIIVLSPPIQEIRNFLFNQFQSWISIVLSLSRLKNISKSNSAERSISQLSNLPTTSSAHIETINNTYHNVIQLVPSSYIEHAYECNENLYVLCSSYVETWLSYQILWDIQADEISCRAKSVADWIDICESVSGSRSLLDSTSGNIKHFGPICLEVESVKMKVNLKYDSWQKSLIVNFSEYLQSNIKFVYQEIHEARKILEMHVINLLSTSSAVALIIKVQLYGRKVHAWKTQCELFLKGESVLEKNRFNFPSQWLWSDQLVNEFQAFSEILKRREVVIQKQMAELQIKVSQESSSLDNACGEIMNEWKNEKPVAGSFNWQNSLEILSYYESRLQKLYDERENLKVAKEALELVDQDSFQTSGTVAHKLNACIEEAKDMKQVWCSLSEIYTNLDKLKETFWIAMNPKRLQTDLLCLEEKLKNFPSWMKRYECYEFLINYINSLIKVHRTLNELKSDSMKERHWTLLVKRLINSSGSIKLETRHPLASSVSDWSLNRMTVGHLWDSNLLLPAHDSIVKEVLIIVQGETAIEEYLRQLQEHWNTYELELIFYSNQRCRLIRGWDDLFNKLREHISGITSMKMSPFYKTFQEEAVMWEEKLNKALILYDSWMDLQRKWVYLDGIFSISADSSRSSDIKTLLPVETQKFATITSELLTIMKKLVKNPIALNVFDEINPNLTCIIERLSEHLSKIQKSLGEYLEKQRQQFPRFYFVGDEDLLEIIGNSNDVTKVEKHLKKMFAGIASLLIETTGNDSDQNDQVSNQFISGFCSKEGETVLLTEKIDLSQFPSIHQWLTELENRTKCSLAFYLESAISILKNILHFEKVKQPSCDEFYAFLQKFPEQIILVATQIWWTDCVEKSFKSNELSVSEVALNLEWILNSLASNLSSSQSESFSAIFRHKCESLITEVVHQRDVTRRLAETNIPDEGDSKSENFIWLSQMRFYWNNSSQEDVTKRCVVKIADASFIYGFEYLGIMDRLVQTSLTDRCFLTLTQALKYRLGGSPFGPAGTGKTESVKALGSTIGRFVLVFCCDEAFDFQAVGRIFVGLCQVGAWGCFDEFNRLEERMLSAVSQQIQTIQNALKKSQVDKSNLKIELVGRDVTVNENLAIFITMNPGYAGRSNLPDNLKKLFRSCAMIKPDREMIAQVLLYSQGFSYAEEVARKIVPFFVLCSEQLTPQSHYDFGLRALKSVLSTAGSIKRSMCADKNPKDLPYSSPEELTAQTLKFEQMILVQSICDSVAPKLLPEDNKLMSRLLSDVFPSVSLSFNSTTVHLEKCIECVCDESHLIYKEVVPDTGSSRYSLWFHKILQLYKISCVNHGIMLVGPSATGKTTCWSVLLRAISKLTNQETVSYIIDPKAMRKEDLYGILDPNTREWKDGVFTSTLRRIIDNQHGEMAKIHWIIFDGDVDPEWVENLNSTLDDNKLLTLPNGERLSLPSNVRIVFEVTDLKHATLATVSRCGMIWFSCEVMSEEVLMLYELSRLVSCVQPQYKSIAEECVKVVTPYFPDLSNISKKTDFDTDSSTETNCCFIMTALRYSKQNLKHIMDFTSARAVNTLFSLLCQGIFNVIKYHEDIDDISSYASKTVKSNASLFCDYEFIEAYMTRYFIYSTIWAFSGDVDNGERTKFSQFVCANTTIPLPDSVHKSSSETSVGPSSLLIDFEVSILPGRSGSTAVCWSEWSNKVPVLELDVEKVGSPDVVIPTTDTVKHEKIIFSLLSQRRPIVLCGPPGSGKTMTLFSALRSLPQLTVIGLNFSSTTSVEFLLKTLHQHCSYHKTPDGIVLCPDVSSSSSGSSHIQHWLVVFCDEINLPDNDKYGTQRIISFMRLLMEHNGFYRPSDHSWVRLERIQFVAACNPPTDPGRKVMPHRFLRHLSLIFVDYPGATSLTQIYSTFNRAILSNNQALKNSSDRLTAAMVEVFVSVKNQYKPENQPHYIYSPREMTRWIRGIREALMITGSSQITSKHASHHHHRHTEGELVRIWAHEAIRLFQDRLVFDEERQMFDNLLDEVANKYFSHCLKNEISGIITSLPSEFAQENSPSVEGEIAQDKDNDTIEPHFPLSRPILYSQWFSDAYNPVATSAVKEFVSMKLKQFSEEELSVDLVLFDQMLDHALRIDRVLRQPQGHLLLIGKSGSGKTTLARFVSWLNGFSFYQVRIHKNYSGADFDDDLRAILKRAGGKDEKILFVLDESMLMDPTFLERMNTLLANGEIPGLFDGEELQSLLAHTKETIQRESNMPGSQISLSSYESREEIYQYFVNKVSLNLHVVLTMNPTENGLRDKVSASPALFNRCVLNWMGDWNDNALLQVARSRTLYLSAIEKPASERTDETQPSQLCSIANHEMFVKTMVSIHNLVSFIGEKQSKKSSKFQELSTNSNSSTQPHLSYQSSPRHFIDFIQQFLSLYQEKIGSLGDDHNHLVQGLNKIRVTSEQVAVLKSSLSVKQEELTKKNNLANLKLTQMVEDQKIAEQRKIATTQMRQSLEKQTIEITEKRTFVLNSLDKVEPAVQEAKEAVSSIKKQNLIELKSMANPPVLVKMTLEAVCIMLGQDSSDWKTIRTIMMKDDFISRVVSYSTEDLTESIRNKINTKFMSNPDFSFEKVNKASAACGPLVKWSIAQMTYSEMLNKVGPLRNELKILEEEYNMNEMKLNEAIEVINELEVKISALKEEYAVLISEIERIKADLSSVEGKVTRSINLLSSLSSESSRWEQSVNGFQIEMETLCGDVLISSAYLSYAGFFDQPSRKMLWKSCLSILNSHSIPTRSNLSFIEYVCSADLRDQWLKKGLPNDDICIENVVILEKHKRFPLIIDPAGQASKFLASYLEGKKSVTSSFISDNFRKTFESSVRFGNVLVVNDVEFYDPLIFPVLNEEYKRANGRVIVSVADSEIDVSPSFSMYLVTRDQNSALPSNLAARSTIVNFTVTSGSLASQCLSLLLKSERPDIDKKRSDLLKLQGEYTMRLRSLEKQLLHSLNEAKGSLLENDTIVATLETLKSQSQEINSKISETEEVMEEIDNITQLYLSLASAATNAFFLLDSFHHAVHNLYQFSLAFFMKIFKSVLLFHKTPNSPASHHHEKLLILPQNELTQSLQSEKDYSKRMNIICEVIFDVIYQRASLSLLHRDRMILAVMLARVKLNILSGSQAQIDLLNFILDDLSSNFSTEKSTTVTSPTLQEVERIMSKIKTSPEEAYTHWLDIKSRYFSQSSSNNVQLCTGGNPNDPINRSLNEAFITFHLCPKSVMLSLKNVVNSICPGIFNVMESGQEVEILSEVLQQEPKSPIMLCSVVGYDASHIVEELADSPQSQGLYNRFTQIAMGSNECISQAEAAIISSMKDGCWVILKNVHLATQWLLILEKKLNGATSINPKFRLFLTAEINPKLPVSLLRSSRVLCFESPPGIRSNMQRALLDISSASKQSSDDPASVKPPVERGHIHFLLAWSYSIFVERLRYTPIGWCKHYEFNESDLRISMDMIDSWVDSVSHGRSNIAPKSIPWTAISNLLCNVIFGGKVDNECDLKILSSFVYSLFRAESLENDSFHLTSGFSEDELTSSENSVNKQKLIIKWSASKNYNSFLEWCHKFLSEEQTPSWLGLSQSSETVILMKKTSYLLFTVRQILGCDVVGQASQSQNDVVDGLDQDNHGEYQQSLVNEKKHGIQFEKLISSVECWLKMLQEDPFSSMAQVKENSQAPDSIYRFFKREIEYTKKLHKSVRKSLENVLSFMSGHSRQTNATDNLLHDIKRCQIPLEWKKAYPTPDGMFLNQWFTAFNNRILYLSTVNEKINSTKGQLVGCLLNGSVDVLLSGLSIPEAFITASRQYVAQKNKFSLEQLSLYVVIENTSFVENISKTQTWIDCKFTLTGIHLSGASFDPESHIFSISESMSTPVPKMFLTWRPTDLKVESADIIKIPVFLNKDRKTLLFYADARVADQGTDTFEEVSRMFCQRGVCFIVCS